MTWKAPYPDPGVVQAYNGLVPDLGTRLVECYLSEVSEITKLRASEVEARNSVLTARAHSIRVAPWLLFGSVITIAAAGAFIAYFAPVPGIIGVVASAGLGLGSIMVGRRVKPVDGPPVDRSSQ